MEFAELVRTRRSIRKFKPEAVEWGKIVEILNAGRVAPSAGNLQNWKFVVVQDEVQRKKVADACEEQEWISTAPAIIVVLGEPEKAERMYGSRGKFLYTIQNCASAAISMIYAAHDQGLGACWVGAYDEDKLRSVLVLPENIFVHAVIPIGYPAESPELQPKSRIEHVSYFERYWNRRRLAAPHGQWSRNVMKWTKGAKKGIEEFGAKVESHVKKKVGEMREGVLRKR